MTYFLDVLEEDGTLVIKYYCGSSPEGEKGYIIHLENHKYKVERVTNVPKINVVNNIKLPKLEEFDFSKIRLYKKIWKKTHVSYFAFITE